MERHSSKNDSQGKNHDPLKSNFMMSLDESESKDLSEKHRDIVRRLKEIMELHLASRGFQSVID